MKRKTKAHIDLRNIEAEKAACTSCDGECMCELQWWLGEYPSIEACDKEIAKYENSPPDPWNDLDVICHDHDLHFLREARKEHAKKDEN